MYGKPIPNGLKKALGANLKRFNEFALSKYNGGDKAVKFKDILKLTHESPEFVDVDLRAALDSLGSITGRIDTDDILTRVFASFCLGK